MNESINMEDAKNLFNQEFDIYGSTEEALKQLAQLVKCYYNTLILIGIKESLAEQLAIGFSNTLLSDAIQRTDKR